ncbi:MAG: hypothetical protein JXA37_03445 [Chloroflexia bacterium]|nr:hypothetical protein [Chloroflexia bacterium]
MTESKTLDVYLYGKLRRFSDSQRPDALSLVQVQVGAGDTIRDVLQRLGVPLEQVGANVFYNWKYSALSREVAEGGRLAVFPDDMQLLYKWYFEKEE